MQMQKLPHYRMKAERQTAKVYEWKKCIIKFEVQDIQCRRRREVTFTLLRVAFTLFKGIFSPIAFKIHSITITFSCYNNLFLINIYTVVQFRSAKSKVRIL